MSYAYGRRVGREHPVDVRNDWLGGRRVKAMVCQPMGGPSARSVSL